MSHALAICLVHRVPMSNKDAPNLSRRDALRGLFTASAAGILGCTTQAPTPDASLTLDAAADLTPDALVDPDAGRDTGPV